MGKTRHPQPNSPQVTGVNKIHGPLTFMGTLTADMIQIADNLAAKIKSKVDFKDKNDLTDAVFNILDVINRNKVFEEHPDWLIKKFGFSIFAPYGKPTPKEASAYLVTAEEIAEETAKLKETAELPRKFEKLIHVLMNELARMESILFSNDVKELIRIAIKQLVVLAEEHNDLKIALRRGAIEHYKIQFKMEFSKLKAPSAKDKEWAEDVLLVVQLKLNRIYIDKDNDNSDDQIKDAEDYLKNQFEKFKTPSYFTTTKDVNKSFATKLLGRLKDFFEHMGRFMKPSMKPDTKNSSPKP